MRSREATLRIRAADEVVGMFESHAGLLARKLTERYAPLTLEGETAVDFRTYLTLMERDLRSIRQVLANAEDGHIRQLAEVAGLLRRREALNKGLYDKHVSARQTLAGLFGTEQGFEVAVVSGSTPRVASDLVGQVEQTVRLLRTPVGELPPFNVRAVRVDFEELATELEEGKDELRAVLDDLKRARKASKGTLVEKKKAIDDFNRNFIWLARGLESLFHLVGESELAAYVKPSARRPGRRAAASEDEPSAEAPSAGEPAEETSPDSAPPEDPPSGDPPATGEPEPPGPASGPAPPPFVS